jgi:RNA polymerase sigma-70 factor (ECF subfamily)
MSSSDADFHDLYEREFGAVFRAAYLISGDRDVAQDAAQEAFARALARWRRLRSEPWAAGWVMTTALNFARRQLRHRPAVRATPRHEPDHVAMLDLRRAIGGLPRRQQEAIALHYLLDLPVREVAQAMGCQVGTVKAHLGRARAALATVLEHDGSDAHLEGQGEPHVG